MFREGGTRGDQQIVLAPPAVLTLLRIAYACLTRKHGYPLEQRTNTSTWFLGFCDVPYWGRGIGGVSAGVFVFGVHSSVRSSNTCFRVSSESFTNGSTAGSLAILFRSKAACSKFDSYDNGDAGRHSYVLKYNAMDHSSSVLSAPCGAVSASEMHNPGQVIHALPDSYSVI